MFKKQVVVIIFHLIVFTIYTEKLLGIIEIKNKQTPATVIYN
jgi:hypothetical protein